MSSSHENGTAILLQFGLNPGSIEGHLCVHTCNTLLKTKVSVEFDNGVQINR